ncbi:MAG: hypothetical protein ACXVAY_11495 [Mucilaginibacter sp.]
MKQQEVLKKIGSVIKELNDQYKYLEETADKLNDFELEFFAANCTYLAQNAELLRKVNGQLAQVAMEEPRTAPKSEKFFEPLVHPVEPVKHEQARQQDQAKLETTRESAKEAPVNSFDLAADTPADTYSYIRQEPEIIRHELEIDESWVDEDEQEPEEVVPDVIVPQPEPIAHKPVEVPAPKPAPKEALPAKTVVEKAVPVADTEVLTVNQKISAQLSNKTEAAVVPITDLKSAITLNDKLLFIKDLFNGYSLSYSEAIEILNRFNSFEEADHYLKANYAAKNNWESKPATAEKFYALLKRRY